MKVKIIAVLVTMLMIATVFTIMPTVTADDGNWALETIDSVGSACHNSLALDSNNNPHIVYCPYNSEFTVKYAKKTGTTWNTETIESTTGPSCSIDMDSNNKPHIAYRQSGSLQDLKYAKKIDSSWTTETVDSDGNVGRYSSLVLDSNNYPHIAYLDDTNKDLKYAKKTSSGWALETIDSEGNVGRECSIDLDSNNRPHIVYTGYNNDCCLKYARWTGSIWHIETIDSDGDTGWENDIAIDSNNNVHVSYFKGGSDNDLRYAIRSGSSWTKTTISTNGGRTTSIDVDSNNKPHISCYNLDDDLCYWEKTGSSWSMEVVTSDGDSRHSSIKLDSDDYPCISFHYDTSPYALKYAKKEEPNTPPNQPSDQEPPPRESNVNIEEDYNNRVRLGVKVSDPDGDDMTVSFYGNKGNGYQLIGEVENVANDTWCYQWWEGLSYNIEYGWQVYVNDGQHTESSPYYSFTTESNPDPDNSPVAADDSASTNEDTSKNIDVTNNDDFGGDGPASKAIIITSQPNHGSASVNNEGTSNDPTDDTIDYTPNTGWSGSDSLVYEIEDSDGDTDTATVSITVNPVDNNNDPYTPSNPSPDDDEENVDINVNLEFDLAADRWIHEYALGVDLSWTGGDSDSNNVDYWLYLGKYPNNYNIFQHNVGEFSASITDIGFSTDGITEDDPYYFDWSTTYYWQVKAKDSDGGVTIGSEWSFITEEYVMPPQPANEIFNPISNSLIDHNNAYGEILIPNLHIPLDYNWPLPWDNPMTNWGSNMPDDVSSELVGTGYGAELIEPKIARAAVKGNHDYGLIGDIVEAFFGVPVRAPIPVTFFSEKLLGFHYKVPELAETEGDKNVHSAKVSISGTFSGDYATYECAAARAYVHLVVDDAVDENTGIYPSTHCTNIKQLKRFEIGSFEIADFLEIAPDVEDSFEYELDHSESDTFHGVKFEEGEEYIIWVVVGISVLTEGGAIEIPFTEIEINFLQGHGWGDVKFDLDEIKIEYYNPPKATDVIQHHPVIESLTCDTNNGDLMPGQTATFTACATDANDGDQLRYQFDWGDGAHSEWTNFFDSDESVDMTHSWDESGTYFVRVKAMDDSFYYDADGLKQYYGLTNNISASTPLIVAVKKPDGSISMESPICGDELKKGLSYDVSWESAGENGEEVVIMLYNVEEVGVDGHPYFSFEIGRTSVSAGSFSWVIPSEGDNILPNDNYTIALYTIASCDSSSTFTIVEPDDTYANPDSAYTDEDNSVKINVLSNDDYDEDWPVSITDVGNPNHGIAEITNDQQIKYIPNDNYNGVDSFTYTILSTPPNDRSNNKQSTLLSRPLRELMGHSKLSQFLSRFPIFSNPLSETTNMGTESTGSVHVTIKPVNDKPVAVADVVDVDEDFEALIDVLANDNDIDGDAILLNSIDDKSEKGGVLSRDESGSPNDKSDDKIIYIPAPNYCGEGSYADSFEYTVSDGNASASATVTVNVHNIDNDPPTTPNIEGPSSSLQGGVEYTYIFDVDDPDANDGDEVYIIVEWNEYDLRDPERHGPFDPRDEIAIPHEWTFRLLRKERRIKARAEDTYGELSKDYGYLPVVVAKDKQKNHPLLLPQVMDKLMGRLQSISKQLSHNIFTEYNTKKPSNDQYSTHSIASNTIPNSKTVSTIKTTRSASSNLKQNTKATMLIR